MQGEGLIVGKNGDTAAGFDNVIILAPLLIVSDDDLAFISAGEGMAERALLPLTLRSRLQDGLRRVALLVALTVERGGYAMRLHHYEDQPPHQAF